jgi:hypothetical protein
MASFIPVALSLHEKYLRRFHRSFAALYQPVAMQPSARIGVAGRTLMLVAGSRAEFCVAHLARLRAYQRLEKLLLRAIEAREYTLLQYLLQRVRRPSGTRLRRPSSPCRGLRSGFSDSRAD